MSEHIYVKGSQGHVIRMDLPLHEAIQGQLNRGDLVRVANTAGDPWQPPVTVTSQPSEVDEQLDKALERIAELEAELAAAREPKAKRTKKPAEPEGTPTETEPVKE